MSGNWVKPIPIAQLVADLGGREAVDLEDPVISEMLAESDKRASANGD